MTKVCGPMGCDAHHPPDSGIRRFSQKHSKTNFWQLFQYTQKTLKKHSGAFDKCRKTIKKHSPECFWSVFVIKNGAGGSSGCGRFGREPICDPKTFQKQSKNTLGNVFWMFFDIFRRRRNAFWVFSGGIGKVAKKCFLSVFGQILESQNLAGDGHHKPSVLDIRKSQISR